MLQIYKTTKIEQTQTFTVNEVCSLIDQMDDQGLLKVIGRAVNKLTDEKTLVKLTKNEKQIILRFLDIKFKTIEETVKQAKTKTNYKK